MYEKERTVGAALAQSVPKGNIIRFDALECRLYGKFGDSCFGPWDAVSGAGLNSHRKLQGTKLSAWLPTTSKDSKLGIRGGVIPPGWWIALPEILGKGQASSFLNSGAAPTDASIKLVPVKLDDSDSAMFKECARGGFYIHGASRDPSKKGSGSDGCILLEPDKRKWLASLILRGNGAWLYVHLNAAAINKMIEFQSSHANIA